MARRTRAARNRNIIDPAAVYQEAVEGMDAIDQVDAWRSKHRALREKWCAGKFGIGYQRFLKPSGIWVNDSNEGVDADFFLYVDDREYAFQTTEAREPNWPPRHAEFKALARGELRSRPYEPERGRLEGPIWIRDQIESKIKQRYSNTKALSLLVYANFPARELEYEKIVEANLEVSSAFFSVWILTHTHLCSVSSTEELGSLHGWAPIEAE